MYSLILTQPLLAQLTTRNPYIMSGFKNFAIVGVGNIGTYVLEELLIAKAEGIIDKVVILTRPVRLAHRTSV